MAARIAATARRREITQPAIRLAADLNTTCRIRVLIVLIASKGLERARLPSPARFSLTCAPGPIRSPILAVAEDGGKIVAYSCVTLPPWPGGSRGLLAPAGPADRAQAHLQRHRIVGLDVAVEGKVANIVQAQHVAIVDIADAHPGLVELAGLDVVAGRGQERPVRGDLVGRLQQDPLPFVEEAELRLGRIVAVQDGQAPAVEIGGRLDLEPLEREVILVKAEARGELVDAVRLILQPRHVVRARGVEAAVEARIGGVAGREGISAEQL